MAVPSCDKHGFGGAYRSARSALVSAGGGCRMLYLSVRAFLSGINHSSCLVVSLRAERR